MSDPKPLHGEWNIQDAANSRSLSVNFPVEHEVYNRHLFQKDGHFICGLKDQHGFPRKWNGTEVHILTLRYSGESPLLRGQQVLRVMSDSSETADALMVQTIRETLFAHFSASQVAQSEHAAWLALNEKRNQFQSFINAHYAREIQAGKHINLLTVFDVAVHYMRKERNRLHRRVMRLIRRDKPVPESPWVPEEWK